MTLHNRRFTIVILKLMVISLLGCNSNPEFVSKLNEFEDIAAMSYPRHMESHKTSQIAL